MAEVISGRKVFSLEEFASSIQRMFSQHYCGQYWLRAEIAKLNLYTKTGHCYPDLVDNRAGKTVAAVSAFIHKKNLQAFNQKFIASVGEPIKDGMKVFLLCAVSFSKNRGVRLEVVDLDIDSIIGEQARNQQNSILKLKSEGVYALNKNLKLPTIAKRIAVVSVETSKGFQDFSAIVKENPFIKVKLFPAQMLGPRAVSQISDSLGEVRKQKENFDAVCIIRGGGGDVALQCFNDLDLARAVAAFPIPVLTGIGHVTNKTVVEEVAHQDFVSPSDLAKFLVDRFVSEYQHLISTVGKIHNLLRLRLASRARIISSPSSGIRYKFSVAFERKFLNIKSLAEKFSRKSHEILAQERGAVCSKASHIVLMAGSGCRAHLSLLDGISAKLLPVDHKQAAFKVYGPANLRMAAEPPTGFSFLLADNTDFSIRSLRPGDVIRVNTPQGIVVASVLRVEDSQKQNETADIQ